MHTGDTLLQSRSRTNLGFVDTTKALEACVALFSLEMDDQLAAGLDAALQEEDTSRGERKTQSAKLESFPGLLEKGRKEKSRTNSRLEGGRSTSEARPLCLWSLPSQGRKAVASGPSSVDCPEMSMLRAARV